LCLSAIMRRTWFERFNSTPVVLTKSERQRSEDAWKDWSIILPLCSFVSFVVQLLLMRLL